MDQRSGFWHWIQAVTLTWPNVKSHLKAHPPSHQLNAASACLLQLLNLIGVTFTSLVVVSPWFGLCIDLLKFQFLRVGLESLH